MRNLLRLALGAVYILIVAAALGLACNTLRSNGLPLIRKPLGDTRPHVRPEQLQSHNPITAPSSEAVANPKPPPVPSPPSTAQPVKPTPPKLPVVKPDHGKPIPPVKPKPPPQKPAPKVEALFIPLEKAKACFDTKSALFVDARPKVDYDTEHITGALSLYYNKLDELYDAVLGKVPKDRLIVTYCSDPECASAVKLADALVARGHTRVVIFLDGLPGWKDAGYPTASGKEPGK